MLANAGAALLSFHVIELLVASLLLGLLEGGVIAVACRVGFDRAFRGMLVANFASCWWGTLHLRLVQAADITVENAHAWLWSTIAGLFVTTLLVEVTCVRWVLLPRAATWRAAARATVLVHVVSYVLLLWVAWSPSGIGRCLEWNVVEVAALARPDTHVVFYIATDGEEVRRRDLASGVETTVGTVPEPFRWGGALFLGAQADGAASLHVWDEDDASATLATGLSGLVVPTPSPANWMRVATLTPTSAWRFENDFLSVAATRNGVRRELSFHWPLVVWWPRQSTQVADDLALVTLGDQICLLKASTAEIALVARGHGATIAAVRR
jgi:hypothetical protein